MSLALQGGGSHGAFTGRAHDLLEDARLDIEAITGTSAGAMNAVVLAEGYILEGGREGARKSPANFWQAISDAEVSARRAKLPRYVFQLDFALDDNPMVGRFFDPYGKPL